jgi:hypothetical protein
MMETFELLLTGLPQQLPCLCGKSRYFNALLLGHAEQSGHPLPSGGRG